MRRPHNKEYNRLIRHDNKEYNSIEHSFLSDALSRFSVFQERLSLRRLGISHGEAVDHLCPERIPALL